LAIWFGLRPSSVERTGSQIKETPMPGNGMFSSNRSLLVLVACICFAIAFVIRLLSISTGSIDWTDLGLFFGFFSFIV
jgi:hypothetical protein